jgi:hypothetical protein
MKTARDEFSDSECMAGYCDGLDATAPEPLANRTLSYRHGFGCARADIAKRPAFGGAAAARAEYEKARAADETA